MVDLKAMEIPDYNPGQVENKNSQVIWPKTFPKTNIAFERKDVITQGASLEPIEGALEAIKNLRLKGYKVGLIMDEAGSTEQKSESMLQGLMKVFGDAGIMTIDYMYYSIGIEKQDPFVKPSTGMFKRAVQEQGIVFKNGWYVGYTIADAKAAFKVGSRTALINPTEETIKKLNSFANQKIKKKTRIFKSLTEFEKTLK
jgi:histidinol phosphatase-like enzyme